MQSYNGRPRHSSSSLGPVGPCDKTVCLATRRVTVAILFRPMGAGQTCPAQRKGSRRKMSASKRSRHLSTVDFESDTKVVLVVPTLSSFEDHNKASHCSFYFYYLTVLCQTALGVLIIGETLRNKCRVDKDWNDLCLKGAVLLNESCLLITPHTLKLIAANLWYHAANSFPITCKQKIMWVSVVYFGQPWVPGSLEQGYTKVSWR